jgi:PPOX class probable F420-dependent enzyme
VQYTVCFALSGDALYITIDQKPKRQPSARLKRLRNMAENPAVALLFDRYDEDWTRLGWVMLHGRAEILANGAEHDAAQALLRSRYPHGSPHLEWGANEKSASVWQYRI